MPHPEFNTLSKLPTYMRTRVWIESNIHYEEHEGVHTYHQCECDRMAARSSMCALCWKDLLEQIPTKFSIQDIEKAFWNTFHQGGEIFFSYQGSEEENESSTTEWWNDFKQSLERGKK